MSEENKTGSDLGATEQEGSTSQNNQALEMIPKHRYDKRNNELKELQKEHDELKEKLSGKDDLEKQLNTLKGQLQSERVGKELEKRLKDENPVNMDAVKNLVDKNKITFNDDLSPEGIDEALSEVKQQYPELFSQKKAKNVGKPQEPVNQAPVYSRQKIKKMSQEEFAKNKEDILQAYKDGRIKD